MWRPCCCWPRSCWPTPLAWAAAPAAHARVEKSILVTVLDLSSVELATEPLFVSVLIDNARPASGNSEPVRDMRTSLITFVRTIQTASPTAQIALTGVGGAGLLMKDFTDKTADLEKTPGRLIADPRATSVMMEAMIDTALALAKKPGPRRGRVVGVRPVHG